MKIIPGIIIVFVSFLSAYSDSYAASYVDSLKVCLAEAEGEDKVDLLNKISDCHWKWNDSRCRDYSEKALKLAREIGYEDGEAKALSNIGIGYALDGESKLAFDYFQMAVRINKKNSNFSLLAANYTNLGHLLLRTSSDYSQTLKCLTEALNYCDLANNWDLYEGIIDHIATTYYYLGEYTTSLKYLFKLLRNKNGKEIRKPEFLAGIYVSISMCYDKLNDFDRSVDYYKKALNLIDKYKLKKNRDVVYNNLSNVYLSLRDLDNALYFQEKHYELCIKNCDTFGLATSTLNFAKIYIKKKDLKKAWLYLDTSLILSQNMMDTVGIAESYLGYAEYYQSENKFKESIVYFNKALDIFKNGIFPERMIEIYSNLADLYIKTKDFDKAHRYSQLLYEEKEKFKEQNHKALVLAMNVKRESEKAASNYKKEIERQRSDNKQLFFAIALILVIVGVILLSFMTRYKKRVFNQG